MRKIILVLVAVLFIASTAQAKCQSRDETINGVTTITIGKDAIVSVNGDMITGVTLPFQISQELQRAINSRGYKTNYNYDIALFKYLIDKYTNDNRYIDRAGRVLCEFVSLINESNYDVIDKFIDEFLKDNANKFKRGK